MTYAECQRHYRTKKKGVLRVSGVLPKWMVGKFLEREYARLRSKIQHIHDDFEVSFSPSLPSLCVSQMMFYLDRRWEI